VNANRIAEVLSMRRCFLALAVLFSAAAGMASADYILIKVNVGQLKEQPVPGAGAIGVVPGFGMMGGLTPGGTGAGAGGLTPSTRPGGTGAAPGGTGGGLTPSSRPGGSSGATIPGQTGGFGVLGQAADQPAEAPIEVIAVVEVDASFKTLSKVLQPGQRVALPVHTHWGSTNLWNLPAAPEVRVYPTSEEPAVDKRWTAEYAKVFKDRTNKAPSAEQIQKLAEFALTHGLNDKFVEVMKKLAEGNASNEAVVAFLKVQTDLDRPVAKTGPAELKTHLGDYKEATLKDDKGHFVLYHRLANNDLDEVQGRLKYLEESLRTYYYWFALKGVALPVPTERLPALLTTKEPEFKRTRDSLTDPPVVGDGLFARRENLTVFCAKPLDARYDMLDKFTASKMTQYGLNRQETLTVKDIPKGTSKYEVAYCGTLALAMKELEDEAERAGASHDATRQLLFASGLLPRNVTVPEWVLFGMGSFFETAEHSPWPTPAGLSTVYLPAFRVECGSKGKNFEGTPLKTLRQIVTDGYFRDLSPDDYKNKTDRLMKARAATWALTYFLAQNKLGNLERYFKLLSEMPRDLELDDAALMDCFARAFDCVDPKTGKPDDGKLSALAGDWENTMLNANLEAEDFLRTLQTIYAEANTVPPEGAKPRLPAPPVNDLNR
jgi:hypothetical protein